MGPDLATLARTVAFHRDPLGALLRARARQGPVFELRLLSAGTVTFVAEPAALAAVLAADGAGATRRAVLPLASPGSVFGADDGPHRRLRALIEPAFAVDDEAVAAVARAHIARWPRGRPFRLLDRMRALAADVFAGEVLRAPARRHELAAAIGHMLWTPGNPPLPVPGARPVDALFRRRMRPLEQTLEAEIGDRRPAGRTGEDLLGRMLDALPPPDVVDRLIVVLAAAQEPPSIALANVAHTLAAHPDLQTRLDRLDAITWEALRLRSPVLAVLRTLAEPLPVAGRTLAPGTAVAIPLPLVQRDPAAFPDPHAFRPERFADGVPGGAPLLPFGGGARRCIGEPVARAELRAVIPALFERLRLTAAWPRPERAVVRGTVLVPHRGALVVASDR